VGMRNEGGDHDDDRAYSHDSSHRWLRMIREVAAGPLTRRSSIANVGSCRCATPIQSALTT
jgi:hypothetical protein